MSQSDAAEKAERIAQCEQQLESAQESSEALQQEIQQKSEEIRSLGNNLSESNANKSQLEMEVQSLQAQAEAAHAGGSEKARLLQEQLDKMMAASRNNMKIQEMQKQSNEAKIDSLNNQWQLKFDSLKMELEQEFSGERAQLAERISGSEREKAELKQQLVTASSRPPGRGQGPPGPAPGGAASGGSKAPQSVEGSVHAVCSISSIVGAKEKIFFKLRANWRTQLKVMENTIVEMHRIYKRDIAALGGGGQPQYAEQEPAQHRGGPPAFGGPPPGPGRGGPPAFGGPPGPSTQSWRSGEDDGMEI